MMKHTYRPTKEAILCAAVAMFGMVAFFWLGVLGGGWFAYAIAIVNALVLGFVVGVEFGIYLWRPLALDSIAMLGAVTEYMRKQREKRG